MDIEVQFPFASRVPIVAGRPVVVLMEIVISTCPHETAPAVETARAAQRAWADRPLAERLATIRSVRHGIARRVEELERAVGRPRYRAPGETIAAEVLPLADACRFLEREAARILRSETLGPRGRPFWLRRSDVELRREPVGIVLVLGPSTYPLFLPGVQVLQALVAGNAVLLKPGAGGRGAAAALASLLDDAGLPSGLFQVWDESVATATALLRSGVDKVLLTGSETTGRSVRELLVDEPLPAVMALSGSDAVFVRENADLGLTARALRFGIMRNGGSTCIAPRRVFVAGRRSRELAGRLDALLFADASLDLGIAEARKVAQLVSAAMQAGARLRIGRLPRGSRMQPLVLEGVRPDMEIAQADLAAPVLLLIDADDDEDALRMAACCDFALGATIFGSGPKSQELARRIHAGVVVINDMIVPTSDPRVPLGGRGASGYGATRGADGLRELTQIKAVIRRRGRFRPHLDPVGSGHERRMGSLVRLAHGGTLATRIRAAIDLTLGSLTVGKRRDR